MLGRVLKTSSTDRRRPPFLFADQCHFDPGGVAVQCEGPADLRFRDCTFGPSGTAIWLDDRAAGSPPACDVLIERSSFMTGPSPVFRIDGSLAAFQVDDSVIAPGAVSGALGSLVRVDNPRNLVWNGRSNLYGKLDAFLTVAGEDDVEVDVSDFEHWRETPSDIREVQSTAARSRVWESSDPAQDLAFEPDNPTRAFQLATSSSQSSRRGASRGPFGATLVDFNGPRLIAAAPAPNRDAPARVETPAAPLPLEFEPAPPPPPKPSPPTSPARRSRPKTICTRCRCPCRRPSRARTNETIGTTAMPPMPPPSNDPTDRAEPAEIVGPRAPDQVEPARARPMSRRRRRSDPQS